MKEGNDLLLIKIGNGDEAAFSELYSQYAKMVLNLALHYVSNLQDAEEITQDVFIKIYHGAKSFEHRSELRTWIYKITINTALNFIKKSKRFAFLDFFDLSDQDVFQNHPAVQEQESDQMKLIYKQIYSLPVNQKTAFILSYIDELPRQEVANAMSISLKAVESLLQRAKEKIRNQLNKG